MKVELNKEERSIKVSFTEKEFEKFMLEHDVIAEQVAKTPCTCVCENESLSDRKPEKEESKPVSRPKINTHAATKGKKSRVENMFPGYKRSSENTKQEPAYTGFMHLVCERCGSSKSFYTKSGVTVYNCKECQHDTYISGNDVKRVFMKCETCGKDLKYWTNASGETVEIKCIDCGTINKMHKNQSGAAYACK